MPRRELAGKRILVTGASQGIGYALASAAAKRGCLVVATARTDHRLDTLAAEVQGGGGQIVIVHADITDPRGREAMRDAAVHTFGGLDILVNNAGVGACGTFTRTSQEAIRHLFEVNLFAPAELTRLCLPVLHQGNQPLVVNVSSVYGRRGMPGWAYYSASKFAVQGLSDAVRAELSKHGVGVLVVNPGVTQTGFADNLIERAPQFVPTLTAGMPPEQVAEATLNAVAADKPELTLTRDGKLLVLATRFAPWLAERIARRRVIG